MAAVRAPTRPVRHFSLAQFSPESFCEFIVGIGAYFGCTGALGNQRDIFLPDRTEQDDARCRHRFFEKGAPAFRPIPANIRVRDLRLSP